MTEDAIHDCLSATGDPVITRVERRDRRNRAARRKRKKKPRAKIHRWQPNGFTACGRLEETVTTNVGQYGDVGVTCEVCLRATKQYEDRRLKWQVAEDKRALGRKCSVSERTCCRR